MLRSLLYLFGVSRQN